MPSLLDGPRLPPRSGAASALVVLLHGYGADGNDLIDLGRAWADALPDAAFVAPHAPEPCLAGGAGQQWFPLTFRDPHERWRGVNHAAPGLDAFLDGELTRHGLPPTRLALVGFSQGCMMALHVGLRRAEAPAALVGYSGLLVLEEDRGPESLGPAIRGAPPVLLAHGSEDDVIPVDALFLSAEALAQAEVPVEWHLSPGTGHGIDAEALRHGGLFLARALASRAPAGGRPAR